MNRATSPLRRLLRSAVGLPTCLMVGCSWFLPACVAAPDDAAHLSQANPLDQRSENGLVEATVALETAELARGPNDFLITLRASEAAASTAAAAPLLTSVEAVMAAHGHHAGAPSVTTNAEGQFRVEHLDLFMSGRWQVTLGIQLEARSDTVDFALDVP